MKPFEQYCQYLALTRHFNGSYNYFLYNGKVNAKFETFERRKDRYYFKKLKEHRNAEGLIVANIMADHCDWVGQLFEPQAQPIFLDWERRIQSLTYNTERELENVSDNINKALKYHDGQYPEIITSLISNTVSWETVAAIANAFNLDKFWNKTIPSDPLWDQYKFRLAKYKPFVQIDKQKIQAVVKNRFT